MALSAQEQMETSKKLLLEMDPEEIFELQVQKLEAALKIRAITLLHHGQNLKRRMRLTSI